MNTGGGTKSSYIRVLLDFNQSKGKDTKINAVKFRYEIIKF